MHSPLEQFEVTPIKGLFHIAEFFGLSVTNYTIFMGFLLCILLVFFTLSIFDLRIIPTASQFCIEYLYNFVYNIVATNLEFDNHRYFPYIFMIFVFILSSNLLGLFPYSYTLTSQIVLTSFLSISAFIGLILIGIRDNGINFLGLFFPPEAPAALSFLLVPIEVVSFFSRPFSLAIRLFANMTAGHVLLKILTGFAVVLISSDIGLFPSFSIFLKKFLLNAVALPDVLFFDYSLSTVYFSGIGMLYQSYGAALDLSFIIDRMRHIGSLRDFLMRPNLSIIGNVPTFDIFDLFSSPYMSFSWEQLFAISYFNFLDSSWENYLSSRFFYDFFGLASGELRKHSLSAVFFKSDSLVYYDYAKFARNYGYSELFLQIHTIWLHFLNASSTTAFFDLQGFGFFIKLAASLIINVLSCCLTISLLLFFVILELFVSILQAYVFTILLVIYLRDVTELH